MPLPFCLWSSTIWHERRTMAFEALVGNHMMTNNEGEYYRGLGLLRASLIHFAFLQSSIVTCDLPFPPFEEWYFITSLKFEDQCPDDADFIRSLYITKLKKLSILTVPID
ncbi:hypothetical protein BC936DRAFT_140687 [Jimgerdemannia flammicorona]|uniref:Uncharacterized protein n=1 Tax=Jimgerdemannia flammicorona TaxID=994334 RepID=A0A433AEN5_9FUNG|nr:hypothetical protein BC936DRAFT_140687 [Jimgerdemannia flammicorona]